MPQDNYRLLIIEARFYAHISDALLDGAVKAIKAAGADYDVVTVGGALEIPAVVALADEGGHRPAGVRYDGYVALGCVIRGETYHFEVVANESARGLMDLSIAKRLPIGNGILTVDTEAQALARARASEDDKGGFAARACLDMITLKRRLLGQTR